MKAPRAALAVATGFGLTLIGFAAGLLGLWIGGLAPEGSPAVGALERWLASALLAALFLWALFLWLRHDVRARLRALDGRLDELANGVNERFDEQSRRFDRVDRELTALRERTAGLESALEASAASDAAPADGPGPGREPATGAALDRR